MDDAIECLHLRLKTVPTGYTIHNWTRGTDILYVQ